MNKRIVQAAIDRLLANAYTPDQAGFTKHRQDVVLLRAALANGPDEVKRWRWLREHIRLRMLQVALDERFTAPDRAYVAEFDATIDTAMEREKDSGWAHKPKARKKPFAKDLDEELQQLGGAE